MKQWQHLGATLTGIAALLTAGIGLYNCFVESNKNMNQLQRKVKRLYGVVNDKDGWVNLREHPTIDSPVLAKILNGTNLEIHQKNNNWYKVSTESGRYGYVFADRLIIFEYE